MMEELITTEAEDTFILSELELYNWGPFHGKHRAEFDKRGTAVIGSTGSGKTTLVDALMTLIADSPRYNLASTGGHDKKDRTLLSYIRGEGGDSEGNPTARPGKTVTGIAATYRNFSETVRAIAIFWTDGTSNSQQDLKRRWFVAEDPEQTLDTLFYQWEQGGARQLASYCRNTAGLRPFESKKAYLARLRAVFDVSSNAFNLLNRAAGLKQLDSVDALFRELVLDDKSAFKRALEVAADFDNLAAIHKELEDAQRQQESLIPIKESHEKHQTLKQKHDELRTVKSLISRWYAGLGAELWQNECERLRTEEHEACLKRDAKEVEVSVASATERTLLESYLNLGGSDIQQMEESIASQEENLRVRESYAADYQKIVRTFHLDDELTETHFRANQMQLEVKRPELKQALEKVEKELSEHQFRLEEARKKCLEIETTIREVKASPSSNIHPDYQNFRRELAEHLGCETGDVPFVGELVEVKPDESAWRRAIERAIGSNRLRIMVSVSQLHKALCWVNHRDNRLYVRLQEARLEDPEKDFFYDSYIYKLNIKDHPLRLALENVLARFDYHCVSDTEALANTPHALTVEGSMSGSNGRFDKPDSRKPDEWYTGFDNKDQLNRLARQLGQAQESINVVEPLVNSLLSKRRDHEAELGILNQVLTLTYNQIDTTDARNKLNSFRHRLDQLNQPESEVSLAKSGYETAESELKKLRDELTDLSAQIKVTQQEIQNAENELDNCRDRLQEAFTEEEHQLGQVHLPAPDEISVTQLIIVEREAGESIDTKLSQLTSEVHSLEIRLGKLMQAARGLNEGAYADVGTELADIPVYLKELETLVEEALPQKEKRFLEYLNKSSDQGVTQLLAQIDQEVFDIQDRIEELNLTLKKVDFRDNYFLQLRTKPMDELTVRRLNKARRHLRDAVLKDDGGSSHYSALQKIIEILRTAGNNRHLVGSRALLDARYRLEFSVVEVNKETDQVSAGRSGTQSDSGGEKETMTSHILTACLSYALCPSGANRPLYGTVVLDEAFSKSSQSAARLIVEALQVFGLYPVFVTPNKEISLLKKYTRRAICVQKTRTGSSLACISWEKLAELQPGA
ncbi:MAG: ATP-binding protein [Verrucomicrobiota bacterium]